MRKTLAVLAMSAAAVAATLGVTTAASAATPIKIYQPRYGTQAACQAHPIHVTGAACKFIRTSSGVDLPTGWYWVVG
ncbi:hypothetical protein [Streptomyces fuscigenes]|uniref:hypothetical protein n=1 Tax=Streptomyces fuscigenes TaxID=1528880 RepID=UPI001F330B9A|nr:hypothetical protein [Streptomyces fuscigenes]MCF3960795.1 hypothetical protein [Streptomyces fuscigenes]